jgi:hypothetical protein
MVTIIKCNCGSETCNRYSLSDGIFYQGSGWEKKRAQQYADAINAYDIVAPLRTGRGTKENTLTMEDLRPLMEKLNE